MNFLLDTNHASLLYRDDPRMIAAMTAHANDEFSLCLPSMGKLWYMIYNSQQRAKNHADMVAFLQGFLQLEFTTTAAETFGDIKADLRRRGKMIPDVDIQIASIALTHGMVLLSDDQHFDHVNNLAVENWLRK